MKSNPFLQKRLLRYGLIGAFGIAIIAGCTKENIKSTAAQTVDEAANTALADTTLPTVKFMFPVNKDTVFGTITIKIKATDNAAVTSVECKLDGVSLGIKTAAPYEFAWNTATGMNGAHQLLAKAVDASGNFKQKKITVHVLNAGVLPMEQQLLNLINAERTSRGIQVLTFNSKMLSAARFHAQDEADNFFFGHIGSAGETLGNRLDDAGYPWTSAAENLAGGQTMAQQVFDAWMANSGQRAIMLDPLYKDGGVGCGYNIKSAYITYWVLNVGKTTP